MDDVDAEAGEDAPRPGQRDERNLAWDLLDHPVLGERREERDVGGKRRGQIGPDDAGLDFAGSSAQRPRPVRRTRSAFASSPSRRLALVCLAAPQRRRLAGGEDGAIETAAARRIPPQVSSRPPRGGRRRRSGLAPGGRRSEQFGERPARGRAAPGRGRRRSPVPGRARAASRRAEPSEPGASGPRRRSSSRSKTSRAWAWVRPASAATFCAVAAARVVVLDARRAQRVGRDDRIRQRGEGVAPPHAVAELDFASHQLRARRRFDPDLPAVGRLGLLGAAVLGEGEAADQRAGCAAPASPEAGLDLVLEAQGTGRIRSRSMSSE